MSDDEDLPRLRARLAELEHERATLLRRLDPAGAAGPVMTGRSLVRLLAGVGALALVTASLIWFAGRTPWNDRRPGEGRPDVSREDLAGQALVQVLHACLAELDRNAPFDARLRVVLAANGSASLARAEVAQGGLLAEGCARRAPTLVRTRSVAGAPPAGLDVWLSSNVAADGSRVTRTGWAAAPP